MAYQRRNAFRRKFRSLYFHITKAVEGKFGRKRVRALCRKTIRRFCAAQVARVKVAIHKDLGKLQDDRPLKTFRRSDLCDARDVLTKVVYEFPFWSMYDLFDGEALRIADIPADL